MASSTSKLLKYLALIISDIYITTNWSFSLKTIYHLSIELLQTLSLIYTAGTVYIFSHFWQLYEFHSQSSRYYRTTDSHDDGYFGREFLAPSDNTELNYLTLRSLLQKRHHCYNKTHNVLAPKTTILFQRKLQHCYNENYNIVTIKLQHCYNKSHNIVSTKTRTLLQQKCNIVTTKTTILLQRKLQHCYNKTAPLLQRKLQLNSSYKHYYNEHNIVSTKTTTLSQQKLQHCHNKSYNTVTTKATILLI